MRDKPCNRCGRPIVFAKKGEDISQWALLDADPVRPASVYDASTIRVVSGMHSYKLAHLREVLEMRADFAADDEPTTAEDFPWHPIHHCKEAA